MTEARVPGVFLRAENATRQVSVMAGAGVGAMLLGRMLSGVIFSRLVQAQQPVPFAVEWAITQLWILMILPVAGWAAGRFLLVSPLRFALLAALGGELLVDLLTLATDGVEELFPTTEDTVAKAVTLAAGLLLTIAATHRGARRARVVEAEAQRHAAARQAEYDAMLESVGAATSADAARAKPEAGPPA